MEGRLQTRKWQDKEGNDRYTTEIVANEMQMLGGRSGGGDYSNSSRSQPKAAQKTDSAPQSEGDFVDDDIPF